MCKHLPELPELKRQRPALYRCTIGVFVNSICYIMGGYSEEQRNGRAFIQTMVIGYTGVLHWCVCVCVLIAAQLSSHYIGSILELSTQSLLGFALTRWIFLRGWVWKAITE